MQAAMMPMFCSRLHVGINLVVVGDENGETYTAKIPSGM